MILRAVKIRLYPNKTQEQTLNKVLGCYRFVYNRMLARKQEAYNTDKINIGLCELSKYFHGELLKDDECRQILMDYYIEYFAQYITHEGASLRLFKICRDTEKVLSEEWSEYRSILTNTFQTEMLLNELKPYIEESTNITYEMDQENDFFRIIRFYFHE